MSAEPTQILASARRMARSAALRVATDGDEPDLAELLQLRRDLDNEIGKTVAALRARGWSWTRIGAGAGITKQSAQSRWGSR